MTDLTFSLDFIVLGRHAPFYVAIEKGFFREENLNVSVIPAKGTAQAIQNVESGLAQIGFTDVASLVVARAEGLSVKVVSVIYQKAPFCFFSLNPGANVTSLKDFEGLRVGSNAGSYISNIARAMMRKNGLDPSKLTVESIEPSARIAMLATRKIPGHRLFRHDEACDGARSHRRQGGHLSFCGSWNSISIRTELVPKSLYLKENPEAVKAFVRATLRGYQYAFQHPAEAAELIQKHAKALNAAITVEELKIVEESSP